jgi:hypothetical protein
MESQVGLKSFSKHFQHAIIDLFYSGTSGMPGERGERGETGGRFDNKS